MHTRSVRRSRRQKASIVASPSGAGVQIFVCRLEAFLGAELFTAEKPIVIGRHREAALRLDGDSVSRRHCRISVRDGGIWVEDLGSANGTLVNRKRIQGPTRIKPADALQVGQYTLKLRLMMPAGARNRPDSATSDQITRVDAILSVEGSQGTTDAHLAVPALIAAAAASELIDRRLYEDALMRATGMERAKSPIAARPAPLNAEETEQSTQAPDPRATSLSDTESEYALAEMVEREATSRHRLQPEVDEEVREPTRRFVELDEKVAARMDELERAVSLLESASSDVGPATSVDSAELSLLKQMDDDSEILELDESDLMWSEEVSSVGDPAELGPGTFTRRLHEDLLRPAGERAMSSAFEVVPAERMADVNTAGTETERGELANQDAAARRGESILKRREGSKNASQRIDPLKAPSQRIEAPKNRIDPLKSPSQRIEAPKNRVDPLKSPSQRIEAPKTRAEGAKTPSQRIEAPKTPSQRPEPPQRAETPKPEPKKREASRTKSEKAKGRDSSRARVPSKRTATTGKRTRPERAPAHEGLGSTKEAGVLMRDVSRFPELPIPEIQESAGSAELILRSKTQAGRSRIPARLVTPTGIRPNAPIAETTAPTTRRSESELRGHLIAEPIIGDAETTGATQEVSFLENYFDAVEVIARMGDDLLDIAVLRKEGEQYVLGHKTPQGAVAPYRAHPGLRLLRINDERQVDLVFPSDVGGQLIRDGETVSLSELTEGRKYSSLRLRAMDIATVVLGHGPSQVSYNIRFTRAPRFEGRRRSTVPPPK